MTFIDHLFDLDLKVNSYTGESGKQNETETILYWPSHYGTLIRRPLPI